MKNVHSFRNPFSLMSCDLIFPLSKEVPDSYLQNGHGGGVRDGFMSKIRLDSIISGVENLVRESNFSITPNPTNGMVLIQLRSGTYEEKLNIKLFDVGGRSFTIQVTRIDSLSWQLDLSHLPPGSYLLTILGNDFADSQIIIKF